MLGGEALLLGLVVFVHAVPFACGSVA
jgi:hypothetical protein